MTVHQGLGYRVFSLLRVRNVVFPGAEILLYVFLYVVFRKSTRMRASSLAVGGIIADGESRPRIPMGNLERVSPPLRGMGRWKSSADKRYEGVKAVPAIPLHRRTVDAGINAFGEAEIHAADDQSGGTLAQV